MNTGKSITRLENFFFFCPSFCFAIHGLYLCIHLHHRAPAPCGLSHTTSPHRDPDLAIDTLDARSYLYTPSTFSSSARGLYISGYNAPPISILDVQQKKSSFPRIGAVHLIKIISKSSRGLPLFIHTKRPSGPFSKQQLVWNLTKPLVLDQVGKHRLKRSERMKADETDRIDASTMHSPHLFRFLSPPLPHFC